MDCKACREPCHYESLRMWAGQPPLGQAAKAHNTAAPNNPTNILWSKISNYSYVQYTLFVCVSSGTPRDDPGKDPSQVNRVSATIASFFTNMNFPLKQRLFDYPALTYLLCSFAYLLKNHCKNIESSLLTCDLSKAL